MNQKSESNRLTDLVQRLRGPIKHPQQLINASHEAADALEALETDFHKQADMNGRLLTENAELRAEINRIKAAFRVNMLRCFFNMSHEEIDAEIDAAILGEK